MKVAVHFANGFEEIEALTIVDVLRRAELDTYMVSITGDKQVTGSHGISITTDVLFEDVNYDEFEMIVLPGGMPGSKNLAEHTGLKEQILLFVQENKYLAAICAAPMVYGIHGILSKKRAVCYPGFESRLEGAILTENQVEQDGKIITSRGVGTALMFALRLVEVLKGKALAEQLTKAMLINDSEKA